MVQKMRKGFCAECAESYQMSILAESCKVFLGRGQQCPLIVLAKPGKSFCVSASAFEESEQHVSQLTAQNHKEKSTVS